MFTDTLKRNSHLYPILDVAEIETINLYADYFQYKMYRSSNDIYRVNNLQSMLRHIVIHRGE